MSLALAVLGGLHGVGVGLKGAMIAKTEGETAIEVEKEKTEQKRLDLIKEATEKENERRQKKEDEKKKYEQKKIDEHNKIAASKEHLHTYNQSNYVDMLSQAGMINQNSIINFDVPYGQDPTGYALTGKRYVLSAAGDDVGRAENRFNTDLNAVVTFGGKDGKRVKQWELAYLAHDKMKKKFGESPDPSQQKMLDKAEQEYTAVFRALSTQLSDIIARNRRIDAETMELSGGRSISTGAYNVLIESEGIRNTLLKSQIPISVIEDFILLPALDTTRQNIEAQGKQGYMLQFYEDTLEASGEKVIPDDINNDDINEAINNKQNKGDSGIKANNSTADDLDTAVAVSNSTGGNVQPKAAFQSIQQFETLLESTDQKSQMPLTVVNASTTSGIIRFEVNPELSLNNPAAIDNYQLTLRSATGSGTLEKEVGLQRYLGIQKVVARVIQRQVLKETDPSSGLITSFGVNDGVQYNETLKNLNRVELSTKIAAVEASLDMSSELLGMTKEYIRLGAMGEPVPFTSGFAQKMLAVKRGAVQQMRQLGFRVDDAGNYLAYEDGETDEALAIYMADKAENAGFTLAADGTLIAPTNPSDLGAYREFLEIQFVYMLARSLENPEGGGARLSVADIENMRQAFGSGKFLNEPGIQLMALQSMTQRFALQYNHLKALENSVNPFQYAAAMHLHDNQKFKGFKRNATSGDKRKAVKSIIHEFMGTTPPGDDDMIKPPGDDSDIQNPYEPTPSDDNDRGYIPSYIN